MYHNIFLDCYSDFKISKWWIAIGTCMWCGRYGVGFPPLLFFWPFPSPFSFSDGLIPTNVGAILVILFYLRPQLSRPPGFLPWFLAVECPPDRRSLKKFISLMMDEKSCKSLYQFSRADNAHARRSRTSLSIMVSPGAKSFLRIAQVAKAFTATWRTSLEHLLLKWLRVGPQKL